MVLWQISDFRPISLLNSSLKLVTKILANRLQAYIQELIHQNQYGFNMRIIIIEDSYLMDQYDFLLAFSNYHYIYIYILERIPF